MSPNCFQKGLYRLLGTALLEGAPASHGPQRVLSSSWVLASLVGEKSVSILLFNLNFSLF